MAKTITKGLLVMFALPFVLIGMCVCLGSEILGKLAEKIKDNPSEDSCCGKKARIIQ